MAWIKVRNDLATDPAVLTVSDLLDISETRVIGCCVALWSYADVHTIDGKCRITPRVLDRMVDQPGFAEALAKAGWLAIGDDGMVSIPKFEKHNGASAKRRAMNQQAKALSRSGNRSLFDDDGEGGEGGEGGESSEGGADPSASRPQSVTSSADTLRTECGHDADNPRTDSGQDADALRTFVRPEKEKEKEKEKRQQRAVRASRLSPDWQPSDELCAWARSERPDLNIAAQVDAFRDYWIAKPGSSGTKLDWDATFRNWVRNCKRNEPGVRKRPSNDSGDDWRLMS